MTENKYNIAIIIPARYGSTRFPGKPLAIIDDKTMLEHVVDVAINAIKIINKDYQDQVNAEYYIATEDDRIIDFAAKQSINCLKTSKDCPTGSDRALQAAELLDVTPDAIINLLGEAPITPAEMVATLALTLNNNQQDADVVTPILPLDWQKLDDLRISKQTNPFSGTSAIIDRDNNALWFSKNIIPAIRNEEKLRNSSHLSPIYKHIGLYGFTYDALK